MSRLPEVLLGATALTAAASGGAFLTFSTLTTTALRRLPEADGMAAMQQINLAAPRSPAFMALIFGPGLLCLAVAAVVLTRRPPGTALALMGAGVYLVGVVGMTVAFHVPRNDALAVMDAATDHGGFHDWLSTWVAGNHVRTLAGLGSAVLLAGALLRGVSSSQQL